MMFPSPVDTLAADTVQIALWLQDAAYQYNRELMAPEDTLVDWLMHQLGKLLERFLGSRIAEEYTEGFLIGLAICFFLLIGWFVYRNHLRLFVRSSQQSLVYEVEEDTIYGVDFDAELQLAVGRADYREAVRLLYLQTLKWLSDSRRIDWQLYKTPTQYLKEYRQPAFRMLTNEFLRVRYGHFEASEVLFHRLKSLQDAVREANTELKEDAEREHYSQVQTSAERRQE